MISLIGFAKWSCLVSAVAALGCRPRGLSTAAVEVEMDPLIVGIAAADQASISEPVGIVDERRIAYDAALVRARTWFDTLKVDPIELRRHGIKGKKKLVELLDAYYRLWQVAAPEKRGPLIERIREVVSITYEDRYHDMLSTSDEWFKQDSTSYLRAAVLMERLGLDTRRYRDEITKIHQRLNNHMPRRGAHQRRVFHWYYQHLGLQEPFPLKDSLEAGLIAQRRDPAGMSAADVYALTHEVYALYEYGDKLDIDPFAEDQREYLYQALRFLVQRYISKSNPDLVAELLECQHYLRMQAEPAYREATDFLLATQNQDGSWSYPRERHHSRDHVGERYQLHTTLVAMRALTGVFDMPIPTPDSD